MKFNQLFSEVLQFIPDVRGKRRVCRKLLSVMGMESQKDISIITKSGVFILPNLKEAISFELFINGSYERGLVDLLTREIPSNGVFIDVGANIGSISISLAKRRRDVKIVAIEASPWIFGILMENVVNNKVDNVRLLNRAVFHTSGMSLPMYAPRDYFGKGSLKPVYTQEAELVQTITLEDVIRYEASGRADFLKVDVEGFEKAVFDGLFAGKAPSLKPRIIFEYDPSTEMSAGYEPGEAQRVLIENGYRLQGMDHMFRPNGYPGKKVISEGVANIMAT